MSLFYFLAMILLKLMTTLASGAPSFEAKVTNPKLQLDPERPGNASHSRSSGFQCHVGLLCLFVLSPCF